MVIEREICLDSFEFETMSKEVSMVMRHFQQFVLAAVMNSNSIAAAAAARDCSHLCKDFKRK